MANPTSNYGWQMPTNTDLVKDLPADFEVFGQAVDTSLADLKGGTSGQILAKNSNTDMDFVWIANDQGDITAVNVTSPITGGGSSGAVTIGIDDGTTAQKGAVQLEDSTSSTSTTKAATPNSVKSAYDLAGGAIAKSIIDAEGDLIVGDAADAVQRLPIGSNTHVLTVDTSVDGKIKWAAPAAGGKVLQVVQVTTTTPVTSSTNSQVTTGMTASITPASASNKVLVLATTTFQKSNGNASTRIQVQTKRGATQIAIAENICLTGAAEETFEGWALTYLDSPATTSSTTYDITFANAQNVASVTAQPSNSTGSIILLEIGA